MKYIVYSDGGSRGNPGLAASAFVVFDNDGNEVYRASQFLGIATNNIAEYTAVLSAMQWLDGNNALSADNEIVFNMDSQLVARQLSGIYKIKSPDLMPLAVKIKSLQKKSKVLYNYIPREENKLADLLVNECLDSQ